MNTVVPICSGKLIDKKAFKKSSFCIQFTEDVLLGVFCYQKTIKFRCTKRFHPDTRLIATFSMHKPVVLRQDKDSAFVWHQDQWYQDMPKEERENRIKWLEKYLPKSRISFMA